MYCIYCGEENQTGVNFCRKCGAQVSENAVAGGINPPQIMSVPEATVKKTPKIVFVLIAIACVAVIVVGAILFNIVNGKKYAYPRSVISFFYSEDQTSVLVDTTVMSTKIQGMVKEQQANFDGNAAIALSQGDQLFYVANNSVSKIADNIETFIFSSYGDSVAYVDNDGGLFLYFCKSQKKVDIANNVDSSSLAISPNGETITYVAADDSLYVFTNGKSISVGPDLISVAVSNEGKYIYSFSSKDKALYVSAIDKNKSKLQDNVESDTIYILNEDHTQIIMSADNKNYISIKGEGTENIGSSKQLYPYFPQYTSLVYRGLVISYPVSSLTNNIFYNDDGDIFFVNGKSASVKLASDCTSVYPNEDGKTVFYSINGTIYKADVKDPSNPITLAENAKEFVISSNGKYVYYINNDEELWCKMGNSSAVKIADNVYNLTITHNNVLLFLTDYSSKKGMLYSCSNGKDMNKIADDVYAFAGSGTSAYYYTNYNSSDSTADLYGSHGKKEFSLILKKIKL